VLSLIKAGESYRHIGSTDMNEKSSRAHTLCRVIIESKDRAGSSSTSPIRVSTLNLVDLAGSESAKHTNSKGERLREAKYINQSLLTLSTIIHRLSEDRSLHNTKSGNATNKQHLPYRDSKLTRLLESSLDGNARISIICTISPSTRCVEETHNTLKFASRAKLIKLAAKINESLDAKTLLRVYREEIDLLRSKLKELEVKNAFLREGGGGVLVQAEHSSNSTASITSDGHVEEITVTTSATSTTSIDSASSGTTVSTSSTITGSNSATSADQEEERMMMLQMIAEMERLILKADPIRRAKSSTTSIGNNSSSASSNAVLRRTPSKSAMTANTSSRRDLAVVATTPRTRRINSMNKSLSFSASANNSITNTNATNSNNNTTNSSSANIDEVVIVDNRTVSTDNVLVRTDSTNTTTSTSSNNNVEDTDSTYPTTPSTPIAGSTTLDSLVEVYHKLEESADRMGISIYASPSGAVSKTRMSYPLAANSTITSPMGSSTGGSNSGEVSVLLGVSHMLAMLKDFIATSKTSTTGNEKKEGEYLYVKVLL
jgi:hypothetical protein